VSALTKRDFQSDQEVRWCPGCGDYAILAAVQSVLPELGIPREKLVIVSGIGCSSRFPYYMNTYGFHGIHGRAPAIATGIKLAQPDLEVWVVTGDGDSLAIGGNHTIHLLRRNVGVKVLLFNNRIYGLTKGQYSPTSERGKKAKSTPYGSLDFPFNPLALALGAGATFVARSAAVWQSHLKSVLKRAAEHKGAAFVEIFQNCNIFNDGTWDTYTDKDARDDSTILAEHRQPLVFGKDRRRGLRLNGLDLEVVHLRDGAPHDLLVHDEARTNPTYASLLATLGSTPGMPVAMGVLRAISAPRYEDDVRDQIAAVKRQQGPAELAELLRQGDTWQVQ
jgi:2-oxoglutarate/2-oxoacid ferredoxin oxidoreductase subunit beta